MNDGPDFRHDDTLGTDEMPWSPPVQAEMTEGPLPVPTACPLCAAPLASINLECSAVDEAAVERDASYACGASISHAWNSPLRASYGCPVALQKALGEVKDPAP